MDRARYIFAFFWLAAVGPAFGAATNAPVTAATLPGSGLPDTGASVLRVAGAFVVVVGIFLAGIWLYRNWQTVSARQGGGVKLSLLEVKSLGQRQMLYVVGYQQQRMLLASTPAGISLLSHLPDAAEGEKAPATAPISFAAALQNVLTRK
jgi:flagellar biogenesis protein FliO